MPFDHPIQPRRRAHLLAWPVLAVLAGCAPASAAPPVSGFEVLATYPHDSKAYTEGLFYLDGELFESTGMEGRSDVRRVRLEDGQVLQSTPIAPELFGEGIVNWGSELVSLTWRTEVGFRWDLASLSIKSSFEYLGEGWGLTQDGKHLIMSDGTAELRFLDPESLQEVRRIRVTADGKPVVNLNELEWVKGEIYANVWQTNLIARIDPKSGLVTSWIDLTGLPETLDRKSADDVANGIAYDRQNDRLFVTGKNWPHLYEIKLTPARKSKP